MTREILIVLSLMLLNGVFAGAEIAVLSVRKTRLAELAERGVRGARAVKWLRSEPERFLATVQIGITVVGTTAAAFGGEVLAQKFAAMLEDLPVVGRHAHTAGLALVVTGISFLEIVVGELVPKSLALRKAERYALLLGPFLRGMASTVKPLVWFLTKTSNLVLRVFGDKTSFSEARLSPEELQELVEEAGHVGSLDSTTSEIASRALDLREIRAADVRVPRANMVCVPKDATRAVLAEILKTRRFSRMPVYEGSFDNVVGYVALKDLVEHILKGEEFSVGSLMRPVRFVPETVMAVDLLRTMQGERVRVSIVVDEGGSVTGLITIEDLLEELVGEIVTEYEAAPVTIALGPDGKVDLPAETPIREVNRALEISLPEPEGFSTLAGLCLHESGRIPGKGTVVKLTEGSTLEVLEASARCVTRVRLEPAKAPIRNDETAD